MKSAVVKELEPAKTLGIHGTSVEQAVEMLRKGRFEREQFSRKNDPVNCESIYFLANMQHFGQYFSQIGVYGLDSKSLTYGGMVEAAKSWARDIAFRHYLAANTNDTRPLGWHVILWKLEDYIWKFDENITICDYDVEECGKAWGYKLIEHLRSQQIPENEYNRLFREAYRRRGCLVGLSDKCREFRIGPGALDYDPEAQIYIPDGLDLKYVSGILPLGPEEEKILAAA